MHRIIEPVNSSHLISVNAGIIGALFIFFAIAAQSSISTIFDGKECFYGFDLNAKQAQISVTIAGGVLILPFGISSILVLLNNRFAILATVIGFALMITSALLILTSLMCVIPNGFLFGVMAIPALVAVAFATLLYFIKNKEIRMKCNPSQ
ncbi:MAG: hypothetical protein KGI28_04490 [Thaumarchaeota archaeon]|nr:hypothetical protein [Nitrososphaerota archaeon]